MSKPEPLPEDAETQQAEKSTARKKLELLQSTGEYLFHGSPTAGIEEFEPRQAKDGNPKTGEQWDDGPPGIAAADVVGPAIFKSIISRVNLDENISMWSSFGIKDKKIAYSANRTGLEAIKSKNPLGYVYVFLKSDFHHYKGFEYRCEKPIRPIDVVEVAVEDLPHNIEIIEDK